MSTEEADNQNNTESPSEKKNFFRIPQFKMPKINKKTMKNLKNFANSNPFTFLMAFVTVYSLFADDVRMVSFPKSWDATFDGITILCLCLFSVEIILFFNRDRRVLLIILLLARYCLLNQLDHRHPVHDGTSDRLAGLLGLERPASVKFSEGGAWRAHWNQSRSNYQGYSPRPLD